MTAGVPVEPGLEEARDWLARELRGPAYREAEPTLFDDAVTWVLERLGELFERAAPGTPPLGWVLLLLLVLGGAVVAYLVYGPPRRNRRSITSGALFGGDDERDAAELRRAARAAAGTGDWPVAIEEMYRAIARGLDEREIVRTSPGTTAGAFASAAAAVFPDHGDGLRSAARHFDDVRYLGGPGSEAAFGDVAGLEERVRQTRPAFEDARPT